LDKKIQMEVIELKYNTILKDKFKFSVIPIRREATQFWKLLPYEIFQKLRKPVSFCKYLSLRTIFFTNQTNQGYRVVSTHGQFPYEIVGTNLHPEANI
jgi:hypothetical protein